jgi:hypothetical protein
LGASLVASGCSNTDASTEPFSSGTGGLAGAASSSGGTGASGAPAGGAATGTGGVAATGGATSSTGGTGGGGATGGSRATGGTGGTGGSGATGGSTGKVFSQCRFHFGTTDRNARNISGLAAQLDFFTPGWMGQRDTFDMQYVCDEANPGKQLQNLVPVIVSYVIAFTARRDENLQDCNVSNSNNLCNYGATYIRAHTEDRIVPVYRAYAQGFANCWGTTRPIVFEMEPDYYQYSAGGDPNALTPTEAGALMTRLVNTMKQYLPNAFFSLDISPWIANNGRDWYSHFDLGLFTFINTSGGGTDANNARIRANNSMTWAGVNQVTGKPILADTGYGVAGSSSGEDPVWNVAANIDARIGDGVISISQYNPTSSWPTTISQIRSQLGTPRYCP